MIEKRHRDGVMRDIDSALEALDQNEITMEQAMSFLGNAIQNLLHRNKFKTSLGAIINKDRTGQSPSGFLAQIRELNKARASWLPTIKHKI